MPREQFLKDRFSVVLNHIPMTRNNPIKIPRIDSPCTLVETLPIRPTSDIPQKPPLPRRRPNSVLESREESRQKSIRRFLICPTILLVRRQVEHHIGLDKRLIGLVTEDKLFIRMTAHILIIELLIELGIHFQGILILHCPDVRELGARGFMIGFTFLGEAFHTEDFCRGKGARPFSKEDVMFEVQGGKIGDVVTEGFDGGADFRG